MTKFLTVVFVACFALMAVPVLAKQRHHRVQAPKVFGVDFPQRNFEKDRAYWYQEFLKNGKKEYDPGLGDG